LLLVGLTSALARAEGRSEGRVGLLDCRGTPGALDENASGDGERLSLLEFLLSACVELCLSGSGLGLGDRAALLTDLRGLPLGELSGDGSLLFCFEGEAVPATPFAILINLSWSLSLSASLSSNVILRSTSSERFRSSAILAFVAHEREEE